MQEPAAVNNSRSLKQSAGITLRGLLMGAADVVPGISGGTIAFITGIYEELLNAIKSFDVTLVQRLLRGKFREAFDGVAWQFLAALLLGILTAIFTLAAGISWLLENRPVQINAFFFGLIVGSVVVVSRAIPKWTASNVIGAIVAAAAAYVVFGLVPVETPSTLWFLFLCGAVAICAMILPGISGSFILLILGQYEYILNAVKDRAILPLAVVAAGCVVGILSFVRVLSWTLKRYHNETIAALTGLVLGSLRRIWPWKETIQTRIDRHGDIVPIEQINVLPGGLTGEFWMALLLAVIGIVLALALGHRNSPAGEKTTVRAVNA